MDGTRTVDDDDDNRRNRRPTEGPARVEREVVTEALIPHIIITSCGKSVSVVVPQFPLLPLQWISPVFALFSAPPSLPLSFHSIPSSVMCVPFHANDDSDEMISCPALARSPPPLSASPRAREPSLPKYLQILSRRRCLSRAPTFRHL